ncbi:uncharacterized protein TrAFT101_011197 [Trichoderma asperellum]|uniref:uncharacterized protein n=1 Tax=Trichoderma asperellum TaxID=101201 RepID=UPI003330B4C1|nr:hypothetical protein TrAFT101_011197 [Trichoderma asperellum]
MRSETSSSTSSPDPQPSTQLLTGANQIVKSWGIKESGCQLGYRAISTHSHEMCTASHTEWEMSSEYAAFEGYEDEDIEAEMECDGTDKREDHWWNCLIPSFLK